MGPKKQVNKRGSRPTLSDIATLSGVSVTAVSLVLSGKAKGRRLSDEVIDRVEQAARALDYAPNLLIRSMQSGSTQVLSFYNGFRDRWRGDIYMDSLTTSIQYAAGSHGYDILMYCDFHPTPEQTYQKLNGGLSDGLIFFAPKTSDPLLPLLRASRMPTVLINTSDPENKLWSVCDDRHSGMKQMVEHLVGLGHCRIAVMGGAFDQNPDEHERIVFLRTLLSEQGIEIPAHWVMGDMYERTETTLQIIKDLFDEPSPPTAIFCWHDRLGYRILEHCEHLGIRVPDDVTIVGYDGMHWPSSSHHILGSVALDLAELSDKAIRLLSDAVSGRSLKPENIIQPVRFEPGTTVGPPKM